jgi:ParB/RepB/Spo0J family partition protein
MNAVTEPVFGNIPMDCVIASTTNPRKHFDQAALEELAGSIRQHGVAQPILVRPVANQPDCVEIVAGERRWRASKLANMPTIPAIVRELTDVQALEIQVIENLQRTDVHPIEEAEGYEQLMRLHSYTADQLAEKVNKSKAYIYGRLKLCELAPEVRPAFYDGKLPASTALLIARMPIASLQIKATEEIVHNSGRQDPMSYREAAAYLKGRYMLDLTAARFVITDAKLLAVAGSCSTCPKRTGSQPLVFSDISADVCTDPDCFATKGRAHDLRLIVAAKKKGIPVYEGDAAEDAWSSGDHITIDDALAYFDRITDEHEYKCVSDIPAALLPAPIAYVILDSGTEALYEKGAIQLALEKAGFCETLEQHASRMQEKLAGSAAKQSVLKSHNSDDFSAKQAANKDLAEKETSYRIALYREIRGSADTGTIVALQREVLKLLLGDNAIPKELADLYPVDLTSNEQAAAYIDEAPPSALDLLLMDMAVGGILTVIWWNMQHSAPEQSDEHQSLLALATAAKVDAQKIRDQIFPKPIAEKKPAAKKAQSKGAEPSPATTEKTKSSKLKKTVLNPDPAWPFPTAAEIEADKAEQVKQPSADAPGAEPDPAAPLAADWPFPTGARP